MKTLLSIILPTIIILTPILVFFVYRFNIKENIRQKILISGALLFLFGLLVPRLATFVSLYRLGPGTDENTRCAIGATVFFYFGYLINLAGIPILSTIFYFTGKK
ncbi:hypothetical protein IFO69_13145 [Echinicola sp. CAU 1574]|uniref:Uncharacterized protein n=1 Tax=Echinicola arenosa TaxID=2774144 RepID=A0ABR9AN15_9BACT|nr:hypothetical protein [Echinicola arenosa]MBD8489696.1 hypothetical protein [Echinicola arenosa]